MNDKIELNIVGTVIEDGRTFGNGHSSIRVKVSREYKGETYDSYLEVIKWSSDEMAGYIQGQRIAARGRPGIGKPWTKDGQPRNGSQQLSATLVELLPGDVPVGMRKPQEVPVPKPTTEDDEPLPF